MVLVNDACSFGKLLVASLVLLGVIFSCSDRVSHSSGGTIKHSGGGYKGGTYKR